MNEFIFHEATEQDIAFILEGTKAVENSSYITIPNPLTEDRLRNEIFCSRPKAHILIAEKDGQKVAFTIYSYCFFASEGEGIWITNFYIDKRFRKTKVGKELITEMKHRNPSASGIYCAIARTNHVSRHFFSGLSAKRYEDYLVYGFENDWEPKE